MRSIGQTEGQRGVGIWRRTACMRRPPLPSLLSSDREEWINLIVYGLSGYI
jgi:hypothetical protein